MHTLQAQQHRHTNSRGGVTRSMAVLSAVYHYKMLAVVKRVALITIKKRRVQRLKESLEDKEIRLRQMRKNARMRRSVENESPAHKEARLNDE